MSSSSSLFNSVIIIRLCINVLKCLWYENQFGPKYSPPQLLSRNPPNMFSRTLMIVTVGPFPSHAVWKCCPCQPGKALKQRYQLPSLEKAPSSRVPRNASCSSLNPAMLVMKWTAKRYQGSNCNSKGFHVCWFYPRRWSGALGKIIHSLRNHKQKWNSISIILKTCENLASLSQA